MPHTVFKSGILRKDRFDSDGSSKIVENSSNAHICSYEYNITDKIGQIVSNVVATIDGKDIIPKGIGTVIWSWTDYEGQLHTNKLNNVIYFPYSTVNILMTNALAVFTNYYEVIWVLTKGKYHSIT